MFDDPTFHAAISLAWKILAAAGIIIVTGRIARHAGPVLTGVLIAIPINAGPGLFFIALVLDRQFVVDGVVYSMAGAGAVLVYLTLFVQVTRWRNFYMALVIGLVGWTAAAWFISNRDLDVLDAVGFVFIGAVFAVVFQRKATSALAEVAIPAGWRYLIVRGLIAGSLVAAIATAAPMIGAEAAGLLISFPTLLLTTGWMLNGYYGLDFVARTYGAARKGLALYVAFCLIALQFLEFMTPPLAILTAFVAVSVLGGGFAAIFLQLRPRSL